MKLSYYLIISFIFIILLNSSCSEEETITPFEHPVQAFESRLYDWNWIDVEGMICRDSSNTGIGVRLGENTSKWVIYLAGGGACFNESTCATNPSKYSSSNFENAISNGLFYKGMMNNDQSENPVKDWNFIFIPYCTGDVHSGNQPDGFPLGSNEKQQFVGNRNIDRAIKYMAPYLDHVEIDEMMITGVSAGGFGTHLSYARFKESYPDVKTHLINDSGPLTSDREVLPACLQLGLQFIYDLPVPNGFLFCCQPGNGLADIYTLLPRMYPDDNFGLISYTEDDVIRWFFAAGQNTCTGGEVSADLFRQGLVNLRDGVLKPTENWSTYYTPGEGHTLIWNEDRYYNDQQDGKSVAQWVGEVMDGNVQHIGE